MSRGTPRSWRAAALLVAAFLFVPAVPAAAEPPPPPAGAGEDPGGSGPTGAGQELDRLARDVAAARHTAEAAEQQYTAAAGELAQRRKESADAARQADQQRGRLTEAETEAARLVAEQYRNGGLGSLARLFLADRPEDFLDRQQRAASDSRSAAAVLRDLREARNRMVLLSERAGQAEQSASAAADRAQRALEQARQGAARTEQVLAAATAEQLGRLDQWESALADGAARQLAAAANAAGPGGGASAAGRRAVDFALAQRGKPYLWGGTGPDAFDCSGLTSQAWRAAGVPIPRTSQQQWAGLHHIALRDLRPGDLVIYHGDAGHVALYLGGGAVVHAPHTGTVVKLAPVTMLPILGAVRPDPDAPPEPAPPAAGPAAAVPPQ
ncbi:C40 family peptidase [Kitasatospora cineracea]|uniref:Cell wall-associated NlpC family hydrolase n=1 Tax=Kitasatospora cineracea TaxID=88074 RepID=A0A8G1UDI9_9ACTN|nr:NlpC/P60 family protein [Kitasatospora cineracea]ROR35276.1 cell wall-associated NlpC family hydrolase [Kitasatospora cineracea]